MGDRLHGRNHRTRRNVVRRAALALGLAAVLGACSSGADQETATIGSAPPASAPGAVTIKGFIYQPSPATIAVGDTVTWTNTDEILHTATAGTPDAPTGLFDVSMEGPGASGTHTFTEAGTFAYFCSRHNSMTGEVVVTG
jgi:plastocyanin